jgi:hypothetical protein
MRIDGFVALTRFDGERKDGKVNLTWNIRLALFNALLLSGAAVGS